MSSYLPVYQIELKRSGSVKAATRTVNGPSDAADIFRRMYPSPDRECLVVVCMDTQGQVRGLHTVSVGSLNASIVHPREVFKAAILTNAASIILVHNHPSDVTTPSSEDVSISKRIRAAGEIIGIELLDHVVVGEHDHTSLSEKGLI